MIEYVTRKEWSARPPKQPYTKQKVDKNSTLFIHWSDSSAVFAKSRKDQIQLIQNIQDFHMDTRAWNDIGYSYVLFPENNYIKEPTLFEARRFENVPAAQEGSNTGNGAVCVVMKPGDPLKPSTIKALRKVYKAFPGKNVKGHRDVYATGCPGDLLYNKIPAIKRFNIKANNFLP